MIRMQQLLIDGFYSPTHPRPYDSPLGGRFLLEPLNPLRDGDDGPLAPDVLWPLETQSSNTTPLDRNGLLALTLVHQPRAALLAKVAIELPPRQGLPAIAAEMRRVFHEERNVNKQGHPGDSRVLLCTMNCTYRW